MKFVLDNNIFSTMFRNFAPDVFSDMWESLQKLIIDGIVVSVDEVYCELENLWESKKGSEWNWIKANKSCFEKPTNEECQIVAKIFEYPKFQESIKMKNLLTGKPEADPFLVAKAKIENAILVTIEKDAPNSAKIPCIADKFDVPYMKRDEFYRVLRNISSGKHALADVTIYYNLGVNTLHDSFGNIVNE